MRMLTLLLISRVVPDTWPLSLRTPSGLMLGLTS